VTGRVVVVTGASGGVRGETFDRMGRGRGFAALLRAANLLPRPVRRRLYAVAGGLEGVEPST
jgi:hypothetical protein